MLKSQVEDDLKQAMLARDALKTSVLRMLKSAISYYEINKGGAEYTASDEDVLTVINKEAKQRRDSIEQFKSGGREELADKESKELEILKTYLPEQMSEEDIEKIVDEALAKAGASSIQDMGKVMGMLTPNIKGKADMGMVSKIVREKLSNS